MISNRQIFLICTLLLGLICLPAMAGEDRLPIPDFSGPPPPDSVSPPVRQGQTWEGHLSLQEEPFIEVVKDQEQWSALWMRAFAAPAPMLDFTRHVVACVFLGHSSDWLFSIDFGEPFLHEDVVVVPYGLIELVLELNRPFQAGGQYRMKIFDRKTGFPYKLEETLYRDR